VHIPAQSQASNKSEMSGLYVGRLSPEKGLEILVRASARAGVYITIVGDGPERSFLEGLAAELRAPVRFAGFLSGEALEREWNAASFFAMTSICPEVAPLAMLEALVRGLPALLTNVGGIPELVNLYGGAKLVAPWDVEATAAGLREFARGGTATADIAKIAADLSWDAHLSTLLDKYQEAVARAH
jgi:glycosyltransferase involved in cell wall biosynthesis